MLRHCQDDGVLTQLDCLRYIGQRFRIKTHLPPWYSDEAICHHLLKDYICIHLDKNSDKFNLLILMARKTYSLSSGECAPETADSTMNHEILLGGHLYLMILKEKLQDYLIKAKQEIEKKYSTSPDDFSVTNTAMLRRLLEVRNSIPVASILEAFIATGNLRSRTGLNLQQTSGFTVIADKLNFYRYLSHFRAVHRGAFFTQMRTTAVRKFLPEAWGFICPVHTPDGAPCGLLNHLTALCQVITDSPKTLHLPKLLASLGMIPVGSPMTPPPSVSLLSVVLDGCVLGVIKDNEAATFVNQLRTLKAASNDETVPSTLEIACVPICVKGGQYPGIFLFTTPSRMMRPVINLSTGSQELVGSFEQVYLNIAVCKEEIIEHETTHMEVHEGSILSVIASFTPFSNFNQSPRNIYQCQMGKQTMGTPAHAISFRSDNKLYKLQTPQSPLVRPYLHDHYDIDNYPLGTNAIVAVISYTGYDMEDAMILNRASFHRGFAHATVYKTELIDLGKKSRDHGNANYMFGTLPSSKATYQILDDDGLPAVGSYLKEGDPFYSYIDLASNAVIVEYYKSHEPGYVDQVKLIGSITGDQPLQKVFIKLRLNRNPIIGDKFASRHGQKGICSQKWPTEDMPFAESGMVPDIIFNPHGFPSRMTIGMMIESMAGKSSSLHGLCHDATPFTFSENISAVDHFGKLLVKAGYNYFGNERLYSGIDGREFEADVFFGVVYYQRLRHMVSDKFQVRTTGPIDILTHQPVKGRKRAGGIRFGEMERDALIAHGSSFLLHDRLFNCSDKSFAHVCYDCGSILSPLLSSKLNSSGSTADTPKWKCKLCAGGGHVEVIAIPYVFRYLVVQLAAMNIKLKINTTPVA
jgi:DNA-directed RNA polymerase I subunit RPA2